MKKLVRVFARVTGKDGKTASAQRNVVAADLVGGIQAAASALEAADVTVEITAAQIVSRVDQE